MRDQKVVRFSAKLLAPWIKEGKHDLSSLGRVLPQDKNRTRD